MAPLIKGIGNAAAKSFHEAFVRRTNCEFHILSVVFVLSFLPSAAWSDYNGKVISVTDGDTLTILREREQVKIRLTEIDAPEKKQPFGNRSKQSLSDICLDKFALVAEKGQDRYKRKLGRVTCNGIDANAEQVKRGMAWAYTKYVTDSNIKRLEMEAKSAHMGLWVNKEPIPPWEWRRGQR